MRATNKLTGSSTSRDSMQAGLVSSSQIGVHPRLLQTLQRHLTRRWLQPLHCPSLDAYQRLQAVSAFAGGWPLVLDAGCGTGQSTLQLARKYPDCLVIGIDRSQARLAKSSKQHGGGDQFLYQRENCILVRAELATFWRLLVRDGYIPHKQFLLYPNPWPKPGHLQRRWHGHPVFPSLLALGGEIEMRCNWEIYALEFALAAGIATGESIVARKYLPGNSASPFEKKYLERVQPLYSVIVPRHVTDAFRNDWQPGSPAQVSYPA